MVDYFNYVVMDKMKFNLKCNWTVSFMDNKSLTKSERKAADNSTCLHSDSFEINIGKS